VSLPLRKEAIEDVAEAKEETGSPIQEGSMTAETGSDVRSTQTSDAEIEQSRPKLVQSETARSGDSRAKPKSTGEGETTPLFPSNELQEMQGRWDQIQTRFVDQPRNAVRDADSLVSSAIQRMSEVFAAERSTLEQQWDRGDDVSTEDLRVALQRYRSFFHRVLSV